jgi:hypothetical protein
MGTIKNISTLLVELGNKFGRESRNSHVITPSYFIYSISTVSYLLPTQCRTATCPSCSE